MLVVYKTAGLTYSLQKTEGILILNP